MLLDVGLDGQDGVVKNDLEDKGEMTIPGDYLATSGLHVETYHWVETPCPRALQHQAPQVL